MGWEFLSLVSHATFWIVGRATSAMIDSIKRPNAATQIRAQPLEFDWTVQLTQPATVLAHDYWRARCAGRPMPGRADLDPLAMRRFTEHVGLVEIRASEGSDVEYFIRRAGGRWEEVYGAITGHYLHEFLPPELEGSWRELFDAVRIRKMPARVTTGIDFRGKTWLKTEMFVAPLGQDGEVTMLLMTFVAWSKTKPDQK